MFRAIEFYRDSGGIPLSEALKKQHEESGFSYRGSFRFHRCCLLWLTCQKEGKFFPREYLKEHIATRHSFHNKFHRMI